LTRHHIKHHPNTFFSCFEPSFRRWSFGSKKKLRALLLFAPVVDARIESMVCSGLPMTIFQEGPRRIIFPMLHKRGEATPDTSPVDSSLAKTPASYSQLVRREEHPCEGILVKSSSIESDMPSVASLSSSSEQGSLSVGSDSDISFSDPRTGSNYCSRRWNSKKKRGDGKLVRFDPRIWVHEFQRSPTEVEAAWFTAKEMIDFKSVAIQCIIAYNSKSSRNQGGSGKVLYSHPALGVDGQYDPTLATVSQLRVNNFRDAVAETEVRNVLIVNSHEAFSKLFAKGMRKLFPCAMITTASTRKDALMHMEERRSNQKAETNRFDVIIVDENLKKTCCQGVFDESSTGASFLLDISKVSGIRDTPMKALFVGVCSDFNTGNLQLKAHGADLVWQKPPPLMDVLLRDAILRSLLTKRGRISMVKKLF
jgi:hypothetical protein